MKLKRLEKSNITLFCREIGQKNSTLIDFSIDTIIEMLAALKALWQKGGVYYNRANSEVEDDEFLKDELEILAELLTEKNLLARVNAELESRLALDKFVGKDEASYKFYYAPLGRVLHITAGNMSLGGIDSLLLGILSKNLNIIKLSSDNHGLLNLFCESLGELEITKPLWQNTFPILFKGGEAAIQEPLFPLCHGLICWGGGQMVSALKKVVPAHCKFIEHGPKVSFQVISKAAFERGDIDYKALLKDILTWKQSACSSAQNIFLEKGIDIHEFQREMLQAYESSSWRIKFDGESAVELLKDHYEGIYQEFKTGTKAIKLPGLQIQYGREVLTPTALNGSVNIRDFKDVDTLSKSLRPYHFYLQTCGLMVLAKQRSEFRLALSRCGVKRFTALGEMLESRIGAPHDGAFSLTELTHICSDEAKEQLADLLIEKKIPFFEDKEVYPVISSEDLQEDLLSSSNSLLAKNLDDKGGYFFASGGTTGKPKFAYYSYDEFKKVAKLLAHSYQVNGLAAGTKVANLFMAGNMWSSFSAVQLALEECQAIQLPMGGLIDPQNFKKYMNYFDVKTVFGLPALLVDLSQQTSGLDVQTVFYAGESMGQEAKSVMRSHWGVVRFISAGYASVDVGPIGYQDDSCQGTEHFLFDDLIKLEIINGEGVVSSLIRKNMPVIRYRTGDRIELLPSDDGRVKFKLLGRIDKKIHIWGARFYFSDLKTFLDEETLIQSFQVKVREQFEKGLYCEILEICYKGVLVQDQDKLLLKLFQHLNDVRDTVDYDFFCRRTKFLQQDILCNKRTGKRINFMDLRK